MSILAHLLFPVFIWDRGWFILAHLGVVAFILFGVVSIAHSLESTGSFGFASVHSGTHMCSRVLSGPRVFTRAHVWSLSSFEFERVHSGAGTGLCVHSCSPGITRGRVGVARFIRFRVG